MFTKYRTLDDHALLNLLAEARTKSDIINELCIRLESRPLEDIFCGIKDDSSKEHLKESDVNEEIIHNLISECPVCNAKLESKDAVSPCYIELVAI